LQISTFSQTGGAASSTEIDPSYLANYTVHQIQAAGMGSDTATLSAKGPADQFSDVVTLANNDIYILEGVFSVLKMTWAGASGGSATIRSYNLDAIDGGR